jgi:hypothetical protein
MFKQKNKDMKAVKLMIVLMIIGSIGAKAADHDRGVKVLSTRLDVVYLKVSTDLVGGVLIVFDENGNKMMEMPIEGKKVLIDFINENPGNYVIHIERCNHVEEVQYHRV